MMSKPKTIELDCAPGALRPGDLIAEVIKDTNLPLIKDSGRFFGCWMWDYTNVVDDELWDAVQPKLAERVKELYNSGAIRYGSW